MNEIEKAIDSLKNNRYFDEGVIEMAITALEAKKADKWIPVTSDKLPEVNDGDWAVFIVPSYFGIGENKIIARYFREQGINHEEGWTNKAVARATYWMPLPEHLKEEDPLETKIKEVLDREHDRISGR